MSDRRSASKVIRFLAFNLARSTPVLSALPSCRPPYVLLPVGSSGASGVEPKETRHQAKRDPEEWRRTGSGQPWKRPMKGGYDHKHSSHLSFSTFTVSGLTSPGIRSSNPRLSAPLHHSLRFPLPSLPLLAWCRSSLRSFVRPAP